MTNLAAARSVIERVRGAGIADFCVCGGSRNAPLLAALADAAAPHPASGHPLPASRGEGRRRPSPRVRGEGAPERSEGADEGRTAANLFSFVDERSAAFFALGRIKRDWRPVAVITTSGTAAAELLPATIEAYYSGAPLVLITADRPARFRGTAAPQSIEQAGLFGVYAAVDIDRWSRRTPLHINVEFDEPLIDE